MAALARHTIANREFFEPGRAPAEKEWCDWIKRGVVRGKLIDGKPWVDLSWFAATDVMEPVLERKQRIHGADLLR